MKLFYCELLSQKTNLFSNLKLEQLLFEVVSRTGTGCNFMLSMYSSYVNILNIIIIIKYSERVLRLSCGFIVRMFSSLRISKHVFYLHKERKKKRSSCLSHPFVHFCAISKQQFCIIKLIQEWVHWYIIKCTICLFAGKYTRLFAF